MGEKKEEKVGEEKRRSRDRKINEEGRKLCSFLREFSRVIDTKCKE